MTSLPILPTGPFDVVGSIVLYRTQREEVESAVAQFRAVPLRSHLCIIDNSPERTSGFDDVDGVTYHYAGSNLGYGRAHNLALRASRGLTRHHLVMNTDIRYAPETVTGLVHLLDTQPEVGLCGPRLTYPDGSLQYVCRLLPHPGNLFVRRFAPSSALARRMDERYELRWWDHAQVVDIPYLQGSFMLLRASTALQVGGFDERFFLYGEDIDLTRRVNAVARTLYVPYLTVAHDYRRYSSKSWRGTWIGIVNNARYFNKWGWFWDRGRRRINNATVASLRQGMRCGRPSEVRGR